MPTNPSELWTMVTAVTSIALLAVAAIGLHSLVLAKREMRLRAKRDSVQYAIERCEQFARDIIPKNKAVLDGIAANKIPVFVESADKITFDGVEQKELARASVWVRSLPADVRENTLTILNELEAWASAFVNRIADESVAFDPCAPPFCSFVTQNYALLILLRKHNQSGAFSNVVKLFLSWREKLTMPEVLERLEELQARSGFQHALGKPIGIED
jgi:hypothetical protein